MKDVERTKLKNALRDLFVILLINAEVNNSKQLWDQFKNSMPAVVLQGYRTERYSKNIMNDKIHQDQALLCLL